MDYGHKGGNMYDRLLAQRGNVDYSLKELWLYCYISWLSEEPEQRLSSFFFFSLFFLGIKENSQDYSGFPGGVFR